jgi:hypothetical protein
MYQDLREFIALIEKLGALRRIADAGSMPSARAARCGVVVAFVKIRKPGHAPSPSAWRDRQVRKAATYDAAG